MFLYKRFFLLVIAAMALLPQLKAQAPTITIDSLIPARNYYCVGDTIRIYFTAVNFTGSNSFTARMSKSEFASDSVSIGSVNLTGSPNNTLITYVFQAQNANVDSGYKLRVRSGGVVSTLFPLTAFVVNPKPAAVASLTTQTICSGTSFNTIALSTSNNVNGTTYAWSRNNLNVSGISSGTGDIIGSVLINNTSVTQTVTYSITPTGAAPSFCNGNTITATVVVRPAPTITSTNSAVVCSGARLNIALTSSLASTYQWYADDNSNTIGEDLSVKTTNPLRDTIINLTTQDQQVFYTVIPTSTSGSCVGDTQTITVTVSPKPVLTNDTAESICSGTTVIIPLTSDIPSTYTWRAASHALVGGESTTLQNSDTLRNTLTNTTALPQTVIYTITPNSVGGSCSGVPDTIAITVFPKPAANFTIGATASQCERNNRFTFTATTNAAITNYYWTFGNSVTPAADTGSTVIENFTGTADSIPVKLLTETANGCPDSIQKFINIFPMPVSAFTVSDTTPCNRDTVRFQQIDTTNTASLIWTWGDGTANTTCTGCDSGKHRYNSTAFPSLRTVRLIATSPRNCRDTTLATIEIKPLPIANFTIDNNSKCFNNGNHSFVFTNTSAIADSAGNPLNYIWNFGDNTSEIYTKHTTHTYAAADSYFVFHKVVSPFGCSDSVYKPVVVYVNPTVQITNSEGTDTLCGAKAVALSTQSGFTYLWSNNATTRSITTVDSSAQVPYDVIYSVTVTDNKNCTGTASKTITVVPAYRPKIIYDTLLTFCAGAKAQLFQVVDVGNSVFEWHSEPAWVNGVIGSQLNMDIPTTPNDSFSLYIVATDSLWECVTSDTVTFRISENTAPQGNIVRDFFTLICTNNTVNSYQWGYDNANFEEYELAGETLQSYDAGSEPDAAVSGKYFWVKIEDADGCNSKIYYQSPPQYFTGINSLSQNSFNVLLYPNPVEEIVYFKETGDADISAVEIYTATGHKVYHSPYTHNIQLYIGDWQNGMYLVKIISKKGETKIIRLVKL